MRNRSQIEGPRVIPEKFLQFGAFCSLDDWSHENGLDLGILYPKGIKWFQAEGDVFDAPDTRGDQEDQIVRRQIQAASEIERGLLTAYRLTDDSDSIRGLRQF